MSAGDRALLQKNTNSVPDYEAVNAATLWEALDLPAPETAFSQHKCSRVVMIGKPSGGKRTLCRCLCVAAEFQYPGREDIACELGGGGDDEDTGRMPLYIPAEGDDEDNALFAVDRTRTTRCTESVDAAGIHGTQLSRGVGASHDFVVQRLPLRSTASGGMTAAAGAFARIGAARRTIDFFCCDTPGALSIALPNVQSLRESVLLIVVDVSQPATLHEQIERYYGMAQTHVSAILRAALPNQDEVRRLQMMEEQQKFWLAEEQKALQYRSAMRKKSDGAAFTSSTTNFDEVNASAFRLPHSASTICPMRSILVCTKTDVLEKISKAYEDYCHSEPSEEDDRAIEGIIPSAFRGAMRRTKLSLLAIVSQLMRHAAIMHRSALAGVSSRINTISGPDNPGAPALVHPFYKALWKYICYLTSKAISSSIRSYQRSAQRVDEGDDNTVGELVEHTCTAALFPTTFLPCGLDALGLLNDFVASGNIKLSELSKPESRKGGSSPDLPAAPQHQLDVSGVFPLHQAYLRQQFHNAVKSSDLANSHSWMPVGGLPENDDIRGGTDDLIWDAL